MGRGLCPSVARGPPQASVPTLSGKSRRWYFLKGGALHITTELYGTEGPSSCSQMTSADLLRGPQSTCHALRHPLQTPALP